MTQGPQVMATIAMKEFMEHVRSKRILIIGGLFFGAFLLTTILGTVLFSQEELGVTEPGDAILSVLLFYFAIGISFTSVLAIAMSADAVAGEWNDKTLFLLLSKPISREAMLAGKIIAAFLSVAIVFILSAIVCITIMLIAFGNPSASHWGDIFAGLGIILLGTVPFVAVGVLCSTLFRTPTGSFVVALGLWFLVFPVLGSMGAFIELIREGTIGEEPVSQIFAVLSPSTLIRHAGNLWGEGFFFGIGAAGEMALPETQWVVVAMIAHTVAYLALSFLIVRSRDYT